MKHSLQIKIEQANAKGRKAVIPFLTAGFPNREAFWNILKEMDEQGADIIEIGVPFSDPVADGPLIEIASRDAIEHGVSLSWILSNLLERRGLFQAQLVLMGYANPFYQYGIERLAQDAKQAGVSGFIIPDIQLDESDLFRDVFDRYDLALISLVAPNTPEERMREYAKVGRGFVYVTSVLGVTGGKVNVANSVVETLTRARSCFEIPLALGFGLQTPDQLNTISLEAQPNAAVFGSAMLRHISEGKPVKEFLKPWL